MKTVNKFHKSGKTERAKKTNRVKKVNQVNQEKKVSHAKKVNQAKKISQAKKVSQVKRVGLKDNKVKNINPVNSKTYHISKKAAFIVCIIIMVAAGLMYEASVAYGKYYASRYNKGIAVASNVYFNSDKLTKIDKIIDTASFGTWKSDIDWIKEKENKVIDNIMVYTNNESWSNGTFDFDILIQNYDSNILYNEAGMNVGYKIQFVLLDDEAGATYSVLDYDTSTDTSYPLVYDEETGGVAVTFDGSLQGGTLYSHRYKVRMNLTAASLKDYQQSRVLVVAYPDSPDYLEKEEKQPFLMAGIFVGTATDMKISIASQNFQVVENHSTDFDTNFRTYINDLSGYIYNIKTEGDVVKNADTAIKQDIKIKWKSDYLDISRYDEYYDADKITSGVENGVNYKYIVIQALPYTSINITFYKTAAFIEAMKSGGALYGSSQSFKELVHAYIEEDGN